jgi:hypothetical protein
MKTTVFLDNRLVSAINRLWQTPVPLKNNVFGCSLHHGNENGVMVTKNSKGYSSTILCVLLQ